MTVSFRCIIIVIDHLPEPSIELRHFKCSSIKVAARKVYSEIIVNVEVDDISLDLVQECPPNERPDILIECLPSLESLCVLCMFVGEETLQEFVHHSIDDFGVSEMGAVTGHEGGGSHGIPRNGHRLQDVIIKYEARDFRMNLLCLGALAATSNAYNDRRLYVQLPPGSWN